MSRWPDDYVPLNGCSVCGVDFASLAAFDQHLGGTADKRVHLDPIEAGLEVRASRGDGVALYGTIITDATRASLAALRAKEAMRA